MRSHSGPAFALPDGVVQRRVHEEMVLLHVGSQQYYGLDPIGADIVTRLVTQPPEAALDALARDYDVERTVLDRDVAVLTTALLDAGLLDRVPRGH